MKLSRFVVSLVTGTIAALIYVSQQVETVKIGYEINSQQAVLDRALDQRQMLLYNVCSLKSPENLKDVFANNSKEFQVLGNKQIMFLSGAEEKTKRIRTAKKNKPAWLAIFGLTSLAEANTP